MITFLVLGFFAFLLENTIGLIPAIPVPSWLTGSDSAFATVFGAADSMGAWFPVALGVTVIVAVASLWALSFGIKVARMIVSHLTGGGGAT